MSKKFLNPKEPFKIKHEPLKETVVYNRSSEIFNKNQIDLPKRRLKFSLPYLRPPGTHVARIKITMKNFDNTTKAFFKFKTLPKIL